MQGAFTKEVSFRDRAEDNERAGDRFIDLLIRYFQLLGDNARTGRRRDELRSGYRRFRPQSI
jgi:plasmid stabilization system protein ParE